MFRWREYFTIQMIILALAWVFILAARRTEESGKLLNIGWTLLIIVVIMFLLSPILARR